MIGIAGMHGVSARNLYSVLSGLSGINASILLFPSTVDFSSMETAFEADYSSFIRDNCVGYISCAGSLSEGTNYSDVRFTSISFEQSGVGLCRKHDSIIAEDASKTMVEVQNVTFYYPFLFKHETVSTAQLTTTTPIYTEANINAINSDYADDFSVVEVGSINRLMNLVDSALYDMLQGWYTHSTARGVNRRILYYKFASPVSVDTIITKFTYGGTSAYSSAAAFQLFAKLNGAWTQVFASNYEPLTRDKLLVRSFDLTTASEWRLTLYGNANSSVNQSTYLRLISFLLGNSNAPEAEDIVVDKAVIVPAALPAKYSDPLVEPAAGIPAILMSAGPNAEVDLFSSNLKQGDRIPFIESVVRVGV